MITIKYYELKDIMPFGKYKGHSIHSIIEADIEYVEWLKKNVNDFELAEDAEKLYKKTRENYYYRPNTFLDNIASSKYNEKEGNYAQKTRWDSNFNDDRKEEKNRKK